MRLAGRRVHEFALVARRKSAGRVLCRGIGRNCVGAPLVGARDGRAPQISGVRCDFQVLARTALTRLVAVPDDVDPFRRAGAHKGRPYTG